MTRYLLLLLFFIMLCGPALGLELSLAPGLSVKNALLYAVVTLVTIEAVVLRNRRLELLPVIVPFTLLVGYAFFTWLAIVMILDYPGYAKLGAFIDLKSNFADLLLVFLVFFYGTQNTKDALWLIRLLVWIVVLTNVISVIDGLNIPNLGLVLERDDGRLGGLVGDSNDYGAYLAFFLPASLALYLTAPSKLRLVALAGMLASVMALVMTASRGSYVAALFGSVASAIYLRSYIPARTIAKAAVAVLLFCVVTVGVLLTTEYRYLLEDRLFASQASSAQDLSSGRTLVWKALLESMAEHPVSFVTGFGWGAYESSNEFRYATHNRYLNLLYNLGLIGVFLFLTVAGNAIRFARNAIGAADQAVKPFLIALVFGLMCMLVALVFSDLYRPWLFIWAFCGLGMRLAAEAVSDARAVVPVGAKKAAVGGRAGLAWSRPAQRDAALRRPTLR